jgi:oxygen-independent coproporphyrinogen-3 oxidase
LPREFIGRVRAGQTTRAGGEELDADERAGEALMLGLRLAEGIEVASFIQRFGTTAWERRRPALDELRDLGLLTVEENRVRLADGATMLANEALCRVL